MTKAVKHMLKFTEKEIADNKKVLEKRLLVYKKQGLDFLKSREFILEKAAMSKRKVLDVGTGRGLTAICLAEVGHMVTSIDVEEEMLRIAALNIAYKDLSHKIYLNKMDGYSMSFNNESFGAVFMVEAVHHVDKIEVILEEINRVLISGCKIVLSDFNKRGMGIVDKVHRREGHKHMNFSTGPQKVRKWLNKKGYKVDNYNKNCHWVIVAEKK